MDLLSIKTESLRGIHRQKCIELRLTDRLIKVAFLVRHASQWKYEQLYRIYELKDEYDPFIIIIPDFSSENWLNDYKLCKKNLLIVVIM